MTEEQTPNACYFWTGFLWSIYLISTLVICNFVAVCTDQITIDIDIYKMHSPDIIAYTTEQQNDIVQWRFLWKSYKKVYCDLCAAVVQLSVNL